MNAQQIGRLGEQRALDFLLNRGHRLLHRNYRTRQGEIDLITTSPPAGLHFTEVKTRLSRTTSPHKPADFDYSNRQLLHLQLAISHFLSGNIIHPRPSNLHLDFIRINLTYKNKSFIANIRYFPDFLTYD